MPILITLFQYEAFQVSDVEMSAMSLSAYAAGLPAFIAVKVLAPGFYARQDTKTPVKIAIIAMVSNMALNFIFVGTFLAIGFQGAPYRAGAGQFSGGLYQRRPVVPDVTKQGIYQPEPGWGRVTLAVAVSAAPPWWPPRWQYGDLAGWIHAALFCGQATCAC